MRQPSGPRADLASAHRCCHPAIADRCYLSYIRTPVATADRRLAYFPLPCPFTPVPPLRLASFPVLRRARLLTGPAARSQLARLLSLPSTFGPCRSPRTAPPALSTPTHPISIPCAQRPAFFLSASRAGRPSLGRLPCRARQGPHPFRGFGPPAITSGMLASLGAGQCARGWSERGDERSRDGGSHSPKATEKDT